MDMEGAMRARLLAAAPLQQLTSGRVFWVERPQRSALPAITLQHVTDERTQSYDAMDGLQPAYVQLDVWAATYAEGKALKEAAIAALTPAATVEGVEFSRAFVTARDLTERDETATIFRPSLDFTFHYAAA